MSDHQTLKERHRAVRDQFPANLNVRVHRALSWWQRAAMATDDDGRFIFYWIAFNAAYAEEIDRREELSEQAAFQNFLGQLCQIDTDKRLDALVWKEFSSSIRVLLSTPYVYRDFWRYQNGLLTQEEWEKRFAQSQKNAKHALSSGSTYYLLCEVFGPMYTLRNQLVHGGATWNSSINRSQVRDCANLLSKLIPIMLELMLDNPDVAWPDPSFPVVRS